jgi:hypothetical protein
MSYTFEMIALGITARELKFSVRPVLPMTSEILILGNIGLDKLGYENS